MPSRFRATNSALTASIRSSSWFRRDGDSSAFALPSPGRLAHLPCLLGITLGNGVTHQRAEDSRAADAAENGDQLLVHRRVLDQRPEGAFTAMEAAGHLREIA